MKTKTLFRPIGEKELILIIENGFSEFPPRLVWQPIFYPVLNEEYASQIASEWNTNDAFGNYLGFVTKFEIHETEFMKYDVKKVGGIIHEEIWVPSECLVDFNKSIVGKIEIIKIFKGADFKRTENLFVQKLLNEIP